MFIHRQIISEIYSAFPLCHVVHHRNLALSRVSFLGTDRLSLGEVSYPVVSQLICERARPEFTFCHFSLWWLRRYSVSLQCGRPGFSPWVGKISWRRKWQPTPVFLPRKSLPGWRNLVGHSPRGKESDTTERLHFLSLISSFKPLWSGSILL